MSEPVANETQLPLVLYVADLVGVLRRSRRTIERLERAGQLPDRLPIPGRPSWSRDVILQWISSGTVPRRGRR